MGKNRKKRPRLSSNESQSREEAESHNMKKTTVSFDTDTCVTGPSNSGKFNTGASKSHKVGSGPSQSSRVDTDTSKSRNVETGASKSRRVYDTFLGSCKVDTIAGHSVSSKVETCHSKYPTVKSVVKLHLKSDKDKPVDSVPISSNTQTNEVPSSSSSSTKIPSKRKRKASRYKPSSSSASSKMIDSDKMTSAPSLDSSRPKSKPRRRTRQTETEDTGSNKYSHLTEQEKRVIIGFKSPSKKTTEEKSNLPHHRSSQQICLPKTPSSSSKTSSEHPATPHHESKSKQTSKPVTPMANLFSGLYTSTPFSSLRGNDFSPFSNLTPINRPPSFQCSSQKSNRPQPMRRVAKAQSAMPENIGANRNNLSQASIICIDSSQSDNSQNDCTVIPVSHESPESGISLTSSEVHTPSWLNATLFTVDEISGSISDTNNSLNPTIIPGNDGKGCDSDSVIIINSTTSPKDPSVIEIVDSETEDMEVDDDEMMQSLLSVREQTTVLAGQNAGSLSETVNATLCVNETVIKVPSPVKTKQIVFVIDTNILIHKPSFFKGLLNAKVPGHGQPLVLLPWTVILELDQLKLERQNRDTGLAYNARQAARLLQEAVMNHHPQLVCQKATEVNEKLDMPIHCNDDRILHCCLQWRKKHANDRIVLISRDRNLSTKAVILDLEASGNTELWSYLHDTREKHAHSQEKMNEKATVQEQNAKNLLSNQNSQASQQTGKKGKSNEDVPMQVETVSSKNLRSNQNVESSKQGNKNAEKKDENVNIRAQRIQSKPPASNNVPPLVEEQVFKKLSAVWDLILYSRSDLFDVLYVGKRHPRFGEAHSYLDSLLRQIRVLRSSLNECLCLSPLMLKSSLAENLFGNLQFVLNGFYRRTGTSLSDQTLNITKHQLVAYFRNVDNRLRLSQGINDLDEIMASLRNPG